MTFCCPNAPVKGAVAIAALVGTAASTAAMPKTEHRQLAAIAARSRW
jgi:hypothetical protein